MGTSPNPIAYALSDLGRSVREVFSQESQRRRDELAAQAQENAQRRSLESLRLTGQQQMAELGIKEAATRFDIAKGEAQVGLEQQRIGLEGERIGVERERASDQSLYQLGNLQLAQSQDLRQRIREAEEDELIPLGQHIGGMGNQLIQRVGQDAAMPILSHGNSALLALGYNPEQMVKRREAREIAKQITSDPTLFLGLAKLGARAQLERYPEGSPDRAALQQQYDEAYVKPKDLDTAFQHYSTSVANGATPPYVTFRDHIYGLGITKPPPGYQSFHDTRTTVLDKLLPDAKKKQLNDPNLPAAQKLQLHKELDEMTMQQRRIYGDINTTDKILAATTPKPAPPPPPPPAATGRRTEGEQGVQRFTSLPSELRDTITAAVSVEAVRQRVPVSDLLALMAVESHFNPRAKNPKSTASGLMQLIASTAARYGVEDPFDVRENIRGGAADWERALRVANGDPAEAYRRYYNPDATDVEVERFLAARRAFAQREVAAQASAAAPPLPVTGPASAIEATSRGAVALGRRVGQGATGPVGALTNIFGSPPR